MEGSVSWSELPPELINKIYKYITAIPDYIIFRAVCRSWCFSVDPHPLPLHQSPWLSFKPSSSLSPHLFSFFTRPNYTKLHTLPLPFINNSTTLIGSSYGYLVLHSQYMLSLFNPISLSRIKLPPCKWNDYEKVLFSPPPMCTVLALFRGSSCVGVCRPGFDQFWTFIDRYIYVHDAIFFEDRFYVVDSMRRIFVLDAENASLKSYGAGVPVGSITSLCDGDRIKCYLVGCDSYLFLVIRCVCRTKTKRFVVYGRDMNDEEGKWRPEKSLMKYAVFVGLSQSVMVDVERCLGFRRNCIYFLDDGDRLNYQGYGCFNGDDGVFDMSNGKVEALPYATVGHVGFGHHQPFLWHTPTLL